MHEPRYHVWDVQSGGWDRCYGLTCPYCRVGSSSPLKATNTVLYADADGKPAYVVVGDLVAGLTPRPDDELLAG